MHARSTGTRSQLGSGNEPCAGIATALRPVAPEVERLADAALPTAAGEFRILIFRVAGEEADYTALIRGPLGPERVPLVRLHSECLTGDTLGSLRCDCGEQLDLALSLIAGAGSGVLLYLPQEGRGIGLANKIRAYGLQDFGLDTVDANTALGLPVDGRDYAAAAAILRALGVERARLLTNNPEKCRALERHGVRVVARVPLEVPPGIANHAYLRTKASRMGHLLKLSGADEQIDHVNGHMLAPDLPVEAVDARLPQPSEGRAGRPRVTVHYAQTLDGRIATRTFNSQWISGDGSMRLAHALRAAHQAVLVGVGTVIADNPQLTVRHVPGRNPLRVVLDSTLRVPLDAHLLADRNDPTVVVTTERATETRRRAVVDCGAEVLLADAAPDGKVDVGDALRRLAERGVASVLVEGGGAVITSALRAGVVDRLTVCIAPKVIGAGIDAVGDLDIRRLADALTFSSARFSTLGEDVIFDGQLAPVGSVAA